MMTIVLKNRRNGEVSSYSASASYWRTTADQISDSLANRGFTVDYEQTGPDVIEISYY